MQQRAWWHGKAWDVLHVEVGELWIQDAVKNKLLTVNKVWGEENPADILTTIAFDHYAALLVSTLRYSNMKIRLP